MSVAELKAELSMSGTKNGWTRAEMNIKCDGVVDSKEWPKENLDIFVLILKRGKRYIASCTTQSMQI